MKVSKFGKYLIYLSVIALILRLIVAFGLLKTSPTVLNPPATSDPATYIQLARELVKGEFSGPFYYQPFYYAGFLAPLILIFGESLIVTIVAQAILGSLTVIFTGLIGRIVYSEKAITLTRSPEFAGDVFVVGQDSEGNLCTEAVTFSIGFSFQAAT